MATQERIAEMAAEIVMEMDVGRVIRGYLLPSLNLETCDEDYGKIYENVGDILRPFVRTNVWLIVIPDTEQEASQGSPPGEID